jgi:hypothetical protein
MEYSSYETPTGLYVGMTPATLGCEYEGDRLIVLRLTDAGEVFLNQEQEDWNGLAGRLSEVYSPRLHRTLMLFADDGVPYQRVADAIDITKNASAAGTSSPLDITVRLITPRAVLTHCLEAAVSRPGQRNPR